VLTQQRPTTRAARAAKTPATVPERFVPRFWEDADGRQLAVREIKRRYEQLRTDVGAESYQKDLLCQRATFVAIQLETMEAAAVQGEAFNPGVYTQMVNALLGLLKALGLERHAKQVVSLQTYVQERGE
jgi:hypothetical protein